MFEVCICENLVFMLELMNYVVVVVVAVVVVEW